MKTIDISSFKTVSEFIDYFNRYFALTTGPYKSFLENLDKDEIYSWLDTFVKLLSSGDLIIKEYDYIYDHSLDSSSYTSALWQKVEPFFNGRGRYITPLKMNVIRFIETSCAWFNPDEHDVRIGLRDSIIFERSHSLFVTGGISLYDLIQLFSYYSVSINTYYFFPYPEGIDFRENALIDIEHFYSIELKDAGAKTIDYIIEGERKMAFKALNNYFCKI